MKLKLDELKKAISWFEANTDTLYISLQEVNRSAELKAIDKAGAEVVIILFDDGTMMPKIKKTEVLR
jgi:hypothetical protein